MAKLLNSPFIYKQSGFLTYILTYEYSNLTKNSNENIAFFRIDKGLKANFS